MVIVTTIRLQSTFIQNTVKLFRERLAAKFPECRLPTPRVPVLQGSSSSSSSEDKIILYTTTSVTDAVGALKKILRSGNVVYEERNCSIEPRYLRELKDLVGNDKVRFPMVIVNGKDLCGEEEVEGFYDAGRITDVSLLFTKICEPRSSYDVKCNAW